MIEAGGAAPDFTLPDQDGEQVSLSDFRGRRVVLVFYPLDFSPTCTDQLSVYERELAELAGRDDVELLGISVDSAFTHRAFREKLGLAMPLLSDFHPKGEVARAYGIYSEDYGNSRRGLALVGPDGQLEWTYESPSPLEIPPPGLVLDALTPAQA